MSIQTFSRARTGIRIGTLSCRVPGCRGPLDIRVSSPWCICDGFAPATIGDEPGGPARAPAAQKVVEVIAHGADMPAARGAATSTRHSAVRVVHRPFSRSWPFMKIEATPGPGELFVPVLIPPCHLEMCYAVDWDNASGWRLPKSTGALSP